VAERVSAGVAERSGEGVKDGDGYCLSAKPQVGHALEFAVGMGGGKRRSEEERSWSKRFLDEIRKRWEGGKLAKLRDWDWEGKMAAFLLGELGQVEGATEVAGLVLGDESKRKLATSWASKELFDQALKVAEGIEEADERAWALGEIAEEMAEGRDV
jgi:hypothetical protein